MHTSFVLLSSVLLLVQYSSASSCVYNGVCGWQIWSYKGAQGLTLHDHRIDCGAQWSCRSADINAASSAYCVGYESCQNADITTIIGQCQGYGSCKSATITQTANSHDIECLGDASCLDAAFYGSNGLKVGFYGHQSAYYARLYVSAGTTAYITCGYEARGTGIELPNCDQATVYVEAGGNVDCTSISYPKDYSANPTMLSQPCPTQQTWDGSSSPGTFLDFMRENEKQFKDQPLPEPYNDNDGLPDPNEDLYEPDGFVIDVKDPLFMVGVIAVISILLNCCQSYKAFGGFKSTSKRKKVYQGIAQTDNSDVEMM